MVKKLLSLAIAVLLNGTVTSNTVSAQLPAKTEPVQAEKVKAKVTKIGIGKRATVNVKLRDNTKVKGYIGVIAEEHFTLVDPKHGTVTPIPYDQVQQIKHTDRRWLLPLVAGPAIVGGLMLIATLSMRGS